MAQARNPDRTVPTRRISLDDFFPDVPRHFAAEGDLMSSHLAAALSAVFPEGEEFFVRSVRRFRDDVTDPELKRQVAGFIGQEAIHGRQHRAFNDRLHQLGYPTRPVEGITERFLTLRERLLSARSNLAVTAALEHFTATLAELVLTSEETGERFGHPAVRDLFVWHALEESEAVGGSERTPVVTMNVMRTVFVIGMAVQMAVSLLTDPATCHPGRLRRSSREFRRSPLVSAEMWHRLKDYNRPDFHPDDRDASELVKRWRAILLGEHGSLSDKLVHSAA
jgi:predicted metal-dependent hydrolase